MVKRAKSQDGIDLGRNNYLTLGIGILVIIVGFIFLGFGDITIAPILLVLGYCVVIPLGILLPKGKTEGERLAGEGDSPAP